MKGRLLFPLMFTLAGCFQDLSTDPPLATREIEHVSPAVFEAVAGSEGPTLTVRLVEQESREPVADEIVEFVVRPQSGSIANVLTRTNASGIASGGKWTLPVQAGEAIVDVRAAGLRVSFVATVKPGAPVGLKALDSTIAWRAGDEAPSPVVALVDRFANPIDGAGLRFEVISGGGELPRTEVISANGGKAAPGWWKLGNTPGVNEIQVTHPGVAALTVRTRGLDPAAIRWFDLETAGGSSIPSSALDRGKLGLTNFDPCLCRVESGYFVLDAVQAAGFAGTGALRFGLSGRYEIQGGQIRLIGESGETKGAPPGSIVVYLVRDQASSLDQGRIRLDVARWTQASGNWFTTSWVFKESSG